MRPGRRTPLLILALVLVATGAFAQWESIAPGFEYQMFPGPPTYPNAPRIFVARMVTGTGSSSEAIDSMIAQGQFYKVGLANGGRETVSQMAARYDDAIGFYWQSWGQRSDAVVAINGDYWEREYYPSGPYTGRPLGGQVQGGWFCRRFAWYAGGSGFFWTIWGVPHLGGDVSDGDPAHTDCRQSVFFADSSEAYITALNVERGSDALVLYTPQWAGSTHTDSSGAEVLVRVDRPTLSQDWRNPVNSCSGTIMAVRDGLGNTEIPFDHVVLSGTGTGAATLRSKCVVGQTLNLRLLVRDYGFTSRTPTMSGPDWGKAYGSTGVDREIVVASTVTNLPDDPPYYDTIRRARTAVAYNANYAFFVVVEETTQGGTSGMTFGELASFLINTLGATTGASVDGGGSSCMWVNGRGIVNNPSDGSERATTNGLMMVAIQPRVLSPTFSSATGVATVASTQVRLGPGTNYAAITTVPTDTHGAIMSHPLNGVLARGQSWWKVDFAGTEGWVPESALQAVTAVQGWQIY